MRPDDVRWTRPAGSNPAGSAPSGPPLSTTQFDRAALHRRDEEWLAQAWMRAQSVLLSPRSAVPLDDSGRVDCPPAAEAPEGTRRFLGLVGDVPFFSVTVPDEQPGWRTMREFGADADDLDAALVVSAIALEQWHQRHGHCPLCGAPTTEAQAGWTRICTAEGSEHFPRTDPAVIMLVHDGVAGPQGRALFGRGPQWGSGRFSTLAGFVEPGESLESAVAREVEEEVGVAVRDVTYVASQPWPFPSSLMLGFFALLDGEPGLTLDPVEMVEAGWFTREQVARAADWTDGADHAPDDGVALKAIPPHFSISRFLIDRWLAGEV